MAFIPEALLNIGKIEGSSCNVTTGTCENLFVDLHTHDTTNHVTVTEGKLFLTLNGEEKAYNKGDWITIPAHAEHA